MSDWTQYNHEYTSNILNTPELDPEAYKRSRRSNTPPACRTTLLIAHGMIDDNVFFKDSVRLAQKLIELHKDNWSSRPTRSSGTASCIRMRGTTNTGGSTSCSRRR